MSRNRQHPRLHVYQNGEIVGYLSKEPSGAVEFQYASQWLTNERAYPVSLSLPLREDAFKGAPVINVFDNLLPDTEALRARVAEKVGADGTDAYSLLSQIGRDCVGALQFFPEDSDIDFSDLNSIQGEVVDDEEIEKILKNLARAPLGVNEEADFRISLAGVQEKTALLFNNGQWMRPIGATPTTHIFKKQIVKQGDVDISNSVENEFYGLTVMAAFALPVNNAEIRIFGETKSLVIERFDRKWTADGRLLRIPQEDFCQALSIPSSRKYQNASGRPVHEKQPSMVEILNLLKGSNHPEIYQKLFLKAQILFWLIGATDGHAKNFSIFLGEKGRFVLAPFYDVLTTQPYFDNHQMRLKEMKMAMSVGDSHYKMDEIQGRHFIQTAQKANLPDHIAKEALAETAFMVAPAIAEIEKRLPADFPEEIHTSVMRAMTSRLQSL